jgi:fructose-1,6-bisphosphatase
VALTTIDRFLMEHNASDARLKKKFLKNSTTAKSGANQLCFWTLNAIDQDKTSELKSWNRTDVEQIFEIITFLSALLSTQSKATSKAINHFSGFVNEMFLNVLRSKSKTNHFLRRLLMDAEPQKREREKLF